MEFLEIAEAASEPSKWNNLKEVMRASSFLKRTINLKSKYGAADTDPAVEMAAVEDPATAPREEGEVSMTREVCKMLQLALPVALGMAARKVMYNTSAAYLAHLGTKRLAGAVLAINITEMLAELIYGIVTPLSSLVAEAVGSGNGKMAGQWLQLSSVVCALLAVPMSVFFYFGTYRAIGLLTPDPEVAAYGEEFNKFFAPGFLVLISYTILRLYIHGMRATLGPSIAGIVTTLLNFPLNAILVDGILSRYGIPSFGLAGAAMVINISFLIEIVVCWIAGWMCSTMVTKHKAWQGWTGEAFTWERISMFGRLAGPYMIASIASSWGLRILTFASPMLGNESVAAFNIACTLRGLLVSIFGGFGVAIQVRVAHKLGKGKGEAAKVGFWAITAFTLTACSAIAVFVFLHRARIASIYSTDPKLIKLLIEIFPVVGVDFILASLVATTQAALTGMASAKELAKAGIVSTWVVQLPISLYLGLYTSWAGGVCGFMWGSVAGSLCSLSIMGYCVWNVDWQEQTRRALERQSAK